MFLADKEMAKLIEASFVVVKLDVQEQPDKKALENAGGMELMTQWGGERAGLPFLVVLDATGKKITDSIEKKPDGTVVGNTGYPARANEIAWFMKMLDQAKSKLTQAQKLQMQAWLTEHAPK